MKYPTRNQLCVLILGMIFSTATQAATSKVKETLYDSASSELAVTFENGKTVRHYGVPEEVANTLRELRYPTGYYTGNIEGIYRTFAHKTWEGHNMTPLASKVYDAFWYDAPTKRLVLLLDSGSAEGFLSVPPEVVTELAEAPVSASYVAGSIKKRFETFTPEGIVEEGMKAPQELPLAGALPKGDSTPAPETGVVPEKSPDPVPSGPAPTVANPDDFLDRPAKEPEVEMVKPEVPASTGPEVAPPVEEPEPAPVPVVVEPAPEKEPEITEPPEASGAVTEEAEPAPKRPWWRFGLGKDKKEEPESISVEAPAEEEPTPVVVPAPKEPEPVAEPIPEEPAPAIEKTMPEPEVAEPQPIPEVTPPQPEKAVDQIPETPPPSEVVTPAETGGVAVPEIPEVAGESEDPPAPVEEAAEEPKRKAWWKFWGGKDDGEALEVSEVKETEPVPPPEEVPPQSGEPEQTTSPAEPEIPAEVPAVTSEPEVPVVEEPPKAPITDPSEPEEKMPPKKEKGYYDPDVDFHFKYLPKPVK